jgi:hypothetical protein
LIISWPSSEPEGGDCCGCRCCKFASSAETLFETTFSLDAWFLQAPNENMVAALFDFGTKR